MTTIFKVPETDKLVLKLLRLIKSVPERIGDFHRLFDEQKFLCNLHKNYFLQRNVH